MAAPGMFAVKPERQPRGGRREWAKRRLAPTRTGENAPHDEDGEILRCRVVELKFEPARTVRANGDLIGSSICRSRTGVRLTVR